MDQDRWLRVKEIFHAALDADPAERQSVLAAACEGDAGMAAEVEELLRCDAERGSYLDTPFVPVGSLSHITDAEDPLSPGELLCERFRIVRKVAEGGMGQVFEAFDEEIGVRVALKMIRAEIAERPEAMSRFRQEVRLARQVTHPNVCRTFDLGRDVRSVDGQQVERVFLTMEFLEGETLSEFSRRHGKMATEAALPIVRDVAAALDAAHALGVIHRDMKPANVMLVRGAGKAPDGAEVERAVVTDFGLARFNPSLPAAEPTAMTHSGHAMGTLSYMAPEQLEGGTTSAATDIYAFGLILFEMVTGEQAFPSSQLLSGIAQRLRGEVPVGQMLAKDVPARWRSAIEMCLRVPPRERPASGAEVVRLLEDGPSTAMLGRTLWRRARWWSTRAWGIATLSAIGMSLLLLSLRLYQKEDDPKLKAGSLMYLATVKNETTEKRLDGVTELLRAGLEQSPQVTLLDAGRAGDILQQMTRAADAPVDAATAREIAMRAGAARVVFATVSGADGSYRLNVDVQQPDTTPGRYRRHWSKSFDWKSKAAGTGAEIAPELLTQVREASDWVRQEVGESANDIARLDTPPEEVTTNRWDALSAYMRSVELGGQGQAENAVIALKEAVRLDPSFAMAYARLADVEMTIHHEPEGYADYKKALDPDLERRLTRRERDRIEGMYAVDTWDYAAAVDAFRDYQTFYPTDAVGWMYPAGPLEKLNRSAEAIADLKRAAALAPQNPSPLAMLTEAYVESGELGEARQEIEERKSLHGQKDASADAGNIAFLEGDYAAAERAFAAVIHSPEARSRSRGYEHMADLQAERGQNAQAIATLNEGMAEDAAQGNQRAEAPKLIGRAWLEAQAGNYTGCAADVRAGLALDDAPQLVWEAETVVGMALALAPRTEGSALREAMSFVIAKSPAVDYGPVSRLLALRGKAEAALAGGNVDQALALFRDLAAMDAPANSREYLGRAAAAAARKMGSGGKNAAQTARLWKEASEAYGEDTEHPGRIWAYPLTYPPGMLATEKRSHAAAIHSS